MGRRPLRVHAPRRFKRGRWRAAYRKRQGIIEPVFAQVKFNRKIDCFQRRGRAARSEWRLIAATHNLLKLHHPPDRRPQRARKGDSGGQLPPSRSHHAQPNGLQPTATESAYPTATVRSGRSDLRTLSRSSTRNESRPQLSFGDGTLLPSIDIRGLAVTQESPMARHRRPGDNPPRWSI